MLGDWLRTGEGVQISQEPFPHVVIDGYLKAEAMLQFRGARFAELQTVDRIRTPVMSQWRHGGYAYPDDTGAEYLERIQGLLGLEHPLKRSDHGRARDWYAMETGDFTTASYRAGGGSVCMILFITVEEDAPALEFWQGAEKAKSFEPRVNRAVIWQEDRGHLAGFTSPGTHAYSWLRYYLSRYEMVEGPETDDFLTYQPCTPDERACPPFWEVVSLWNASRGEADELELARRFARQLEAGPDRQITIAERGFSWEKDLERVERERKAYQALRRRVPR